MKVVVIGSGAREHALGWKLAQSREVSEVICVPGNPGMAHEPKVRCMALRETTVAAYKDLAIHEQVDLTVVGPEQPLMEGVVDLFRETKLAIFGPTLAAARLEGSKIYAKELMREAGVLTADFQVFDSAEKAKTYVASAALPLVVKADGLAAGKGVSVCSDKSQALQAIHLMMEQKIFGEAGKKILIEEFIDGVELSVMAIVSGQKYQTLIPVRDHKRLQDKNRGPNTGGMGAYCPVADASAALMKTVGEKVFKPILKMMNDRGFPFTGILYAGLIIRDNQPFVLEFNVRFGDPECEVLLRHLKSDLFPYLHGVAIGRWHSAPLQWEEGCTVGVVLAADGYPEAPRIGIALPVTAVETQALNTKLFFAGVKWAGGQLVTSGGRVLIVTATGKDLASARALAYKVVPKVNFTNGQFRRDIGL